MVCMKKLVLSVLFLTSCFSLIAQSWNLIDMGVGLVIEDAEYDRVLKIAQRGTTWDLKELYENGALAGKYKGNQRFSAWIQGPASPNPIWYYSYTITYPDGKSASFGRYGFYVGGHATVPITIGSYTEGTWRIDFSIWNKNTNETRQVGSLQFTTTWGKPAVTETWQLQDAGVGLIDQTNYDTQLVILERGNRWSQKWLYEQGYLANRTRVFASWLQGPPVATFTDPNGLPIWLYSVKITYPDKTSMEFGPYNFYQPGFATSFLNVAGGPLGTWTIEYFLIRRGTQEKKFITQVQFTLVE